MGWVPGSPRGEDILGDAEGGAGAGAAGDEDEARGVVGRIDQAVGGGREGVGAEPAVGHAAVGQVQGFAQVAQDEVVHAGVGEGLQHGAVVVGVAHHQRSVGALHHDQVDAVGQRFAFLHVELREQGPGGGQAAVAVVAHEAQVAHDRAGQLEALRRLHAQHVELAQPQAVGRDAVGQQAAQFGVGADGHPLGVQRGARGAHAGRGHFQHLLAEAEGDAVRLFQPAGEQADGGARFDTRLVRAVEHALGRPARTVEPQRRGAPRGLRWRQQLAAFGHFRRHELLEHAQRLRPLGREPQPLVDDVDAGLRGDVLPYLARTPSPPPCVARTLAGDGDEAEVADGGSDTGGILVDHAHRQAAAGGGVGMRQADDAGADDDQVVMR